MNGLRNTWIASGGWFSSSHPVLNRLSETFKFLSLTITRRRGGGAETFRPVTKSHSCVFSLTSTLWPVAWCRVTVHCKHHLPPPSPFPLPLLLGVLLLHFLHSSAWSASLRQPVSRTESSGGCTNSLTQRSCPCAVWRGLNTGPEWPYNVYLLQDSGQADTSHCLPSQRILHKQRRLSDAGPGSLTHPPSLHDALVHHLIAAICSPPQVTCLTWCAVPFLVHLNLLWLGNRPSNFSAAHL